LPIKSYLLDDARNVARMIINKPIKIFIEITSFKKTYPRIKEKMTLV
tara:strand:+ start:916 stop:1056 length:141 start_codon:yes stop_codon:yes gene_type:complete